MSHAVGVFLTQIALLEMSKYEPLSHLHPDSRVAKHAKFGVVLARLKILPNLVRSGLGIFKK